MGVLYAGHITSLPKRIISCDSMQASQARQQVAFQCCAEQAVLRRMQRPLLCTSAHVRQEGELEFPEAAILMDAYEDRSLDFVVDAGPQVSILL